MRYSSLRWLPLGLLVLLNACSVSRIVTISSRPQNADITIDDIPRGPAPVVDKFVFRNSADTHRIVASRPGYQDQTLTLTRDDPSTTVEVVLHPFNRRVTFTVSPVPAVVSVNGVPLSPSPVLSVTRELDFTKDERGNWTRYTITATRAGFQPAEQVVAWTDPGAPSEYLLRLQPMRKDLVINTTPPGCAIALDGQPLGVTPLVDKAREFNYDVDTNQYIAHKLKISKNGYDPVEQTVSWDGGKSDYLFELPARKKTVRIATDPAGAAVAIDGKPIAPGPDGIPTAQLVYTPVNDAGQLPVFMATVSKRTAETEWYPTTMPIAWDAGKTDYSAAIKEVKTRPVGLISVALERNADGVWIFGPRETQTLAMKDVSEGPGKEPPALIYAAPPGISIGTLTVSPTGSAILFTLISGKTRADLRSQVYSISPDGTGGIIQITDGKALDIQPSFTPDGDQIVFSSNRAGKRLNIWRKSIAGGAGIEQLTNTEEQDLWPMVDAGPRTKSRLFYEALSDSQPDAQLYEAPVEGGPRLDLTTISVGQPRISPRADSIIFTSTNARTSNREIYRIPDKGGPPVNLTNDPDSDCYDPVWSKDGSQIAYVSDRGVADISDRGLEEDRRRNADIWIMDLARADKPIQVTTNASVDDCPAWDPSGSALYFRSNRGGQWGIWKVAVK